MATTRRKTAKKKTARKSAKRTTRKKAPKRAAKRKSSGKKRAPNAAFMRPMQPSSKLAAVIGSSPIPRTQVISKLWAYIKRNGLQDAKNRRAINADEKLRPLFGRSQVTMFDLAKIANQNLS
jgi:upstream activation factor subunit UAF30